MIIEIRPLIEKRKLKLISRELKKQLGLRKIYRVPHITLVYNFKPKVSPEKIINIVREVARKYTDLSYKYDGYEIKKADKGYVFAFNIIPSPQLEEFRYELYKAVKDYIIERPDVKKYNDREKFWFHASIALRLRKETAERIAKAELRPFYQKFHAVRITLIGKNSHIVYEYDLLHDSILTRPQAKSKEEAKRDFRAYREKYGYEVNYMSHFPNSRIYLISDTHFYHKNIITYCSRPFASVKEMNEVLKKNWNNIVSPKDTVFVLGDFILRKFSRKAYEALKSELNGNKYFVKGNHDDFEAPPTLQINYRGMNFLLVHNPEPFVGTFDGWIIHGHKHNNDLKNYPFINVKNRTINVSAEVIGYKPISLDFIVDVINNTNQNIETIEDVGM